MFSRNKTKTIRLIGSISIAVILTIVIYDDWKIPLNEPSSSIINGGVQKETVGEITIFKVDSESFEKIFYFTFKVSGVAQSSSQMVDFPLAFENDTILNTYVGRKFMVVFISENPNLNRLQLDKPFSDNEYFFLL